MHAYWHSFRRPIQVLEFRYAGLRELFFNFSYAVGKQNTYDDINLLMRLINAKIFLRNKI